MLEPVLRNITIDEGIGNDGGKAKQEHEPQQKCGYRTNQEESQVSAN